MTEIHSLQRPYESAVDGGDIIFFIYDLKSVSLNNIFWVSNA